MPPSLLPPPPSPPARRPPASPPDSRAGLVALVLGGLTWMGIALVVERVHPEAGEGLCLRWLRKLVEHPIRGSLALALALLALRRSPRAAEAPVRGPETTIP